MLFSWVELKASASLESPSSGNKTVVWDEVERLKPQCVLVCRNECREMIVVRSQSLRKWDNRACSLAACWGEKSIKGVVMHSSPLSKEPRLVSALRPARGIMVWERDEMCS